MRFVLLIAALAVLGSAVATAGELGTTGESDYARLLRQVRAARHARRLLRRQGSTPSMSATDTRIVVRRHQRTVCPLTWPDLAIQDLSSVSGFQPRRMHVHHRRDCTLTFKDTIFATADGETSKGCEASPRSRSL